jgi:hypothetical protein
MLLSVSCSRYHRKMAEPVETNNFLRLIDAGIDPEDAVQIARDAAFRYDRNRKPFGSPSGALGMTGTHLFDNLSEGGKAFLEYQPYTTEMAAERVGMSKSAIGPAVNRLIEHGFFDKQRDRRTFAYRLMVPTVAMIECRDAYLSDAYEPGTIGHAFNAGHGKILTKLFPEA